MELTGKAAFDQHTTKAHRALQLRDAEYKAFLTASNFNTIQYRAMPVTNPDTILHPEMPYQAPGLPVPVQQEN